MAELHTNEPKYTHEDLQKHLEEEHSFSPFASYLREIVYGGSDGIVTTFAVVAGFAGASGGEMGTSLPVLAVLLFGLANLFADASSMALGNFLSIRADQDVYKQNKRKELNEIKNNPTLELAETILILKDKGYSSEDAKTMADLYRKNEKYWLEFMMNQELEMDNPEKENPFMTSLATFFSFAFFGFVPLLPYVFLRNDPNVFTLAILSTVIALFLLGVLRVRVTRIHPIRSILEIVLLGSTSAVIAYLVGSFFRI